MVDDASGGAGGHGVSVESSESRQRGPVDFFIDGEVAGSLPGDTDWDWAKFAIPEGRHTLEWSFSRLSWASGSHMAYVDALEFYMPEDSAPEFVEQPFDVYLEGLGSAEFNVEVD